MDLLIGLLGFALNLTMTLVEIGLYWHFRRIGRLWLARIWWILLAMVLLPASGVMILSGLMQPDALGLVMAAIGAVLAGLHLSAPFWNPLPPRSHSFDPDEPDDGRPFEVPDEV